MRIRIQGLIFPKILFLREESTNGTSDPDQNAVPDADPLTPKLLIRIPNPAKNNNVPWDDTVPEPWHSTHRVQKHDI